MLQTGPAFIHGSISQFLNETTVGGCIACPDRFIQANLGTDAALGDTSALEAIISARNGCAAGLRWIRLGKADLETVKSA